MFSSVKSISPGEIEEVNLNRQTLRTSCATLMEGAVICFDFIKWQLLSIYLHQFQNIISPSVCIWSKHSINIMDPVQSGVNDVQITIAFTLQVNLSEAFVCFLCSSNEIDLCANCESIGSNGSGSRHTITRVLTSSSMRTKPTGDLARGNISANHITHA